MNNNLSIFILSLALLAFSAAPALAQDSSFDIMSAEDVENLGDSLSLEDDGMLPMPTATQTETVPDVELSAPKQPEKTLDKPLSAASMLNTPSNEASGSGDLYFDAIVTDRDIRDDDIIRRVDPRFEPGSRYIVVEKGAGAGSHQAMLVAAKRALSLGRYSSALQMFEGLYKKNKRDRQVLMGMAVAQQRSGFTESAIRTYEELLEIEPDNIEANTNMLGLIKVQYPSIAYRRLVDLWENNPRNAGLAAQIGLTSAELGNNDDALHYLGIAASLEPNNANYLYNMAVIVDRSGASKDAIQYYEKALQIDAMYGGSRTVPRDSIYDRLSKLRRL